MSGLWLVSYLVLWALVVALCLMLIGVLRQLGVLQGQLEGRRTAPEMVPPAEDDGPAIGSYLPDLAATPVNGFGPLTLAGSQAEGSTLLMFMSPMCESCQHVVDPLNALADDARRGVRPIAIMRADEYACQAFISVFPLRFPLISDADRTVTMGFHVHSAPFGLLYGTDGTLTRKGIVTDRNQLLALLGDTPAPLTGQAQASPPAASPRILA